MNLRRLSKSRLLSWRQCPKRLWLETYEPDLGEDDGDVREGLAVGQTVGEVARRLYGPGERIAEDPPDLPAALARTRRALAAGQPRVMFEAAFSADGVVVLADVVKTTARGTRVIEVKSSAEVKDYHLEDCAIQAHVIERSGVKLNEIALARINTDFVYPGGQDYRGLLTEVDLGRSIAPLRAQVPDWIRGARRTLAGRRPAIAPGPQCSKPFTCPFYDHCNVQTTEYPVSLLPHLREKRAAQLAERGIEDLRNIPDDLIGSDTHRRIVEATRRNRPFLSSRAAAELRGLPYPRFYLDFETIAFAVPIWPGTRPYQPIPFQWSLHVETAPGRLGHLEFLDLSGEDPASACLQALLRAVGRKGPILVYSPFEAGVLKKLAIRFPAQERAIARINDRLVDLLPLARRHYYHPAMRGSWSIKAVLPTVAPDLDYADLEEVADGTAAQRAYAEAIDKQTPPERREQIRRRLLAYCERDTLALARLTWFLGGTHR